MNITWFVCSGSDKVLVGQVNCKWTIPQPQNLKKCFGQGSFSRWILHQEGYNALIAVSRCIFDWKEWPHIGNIFQVIYLSTLLYIMTVRNSPLRRCYCLSSRALVKIYTEQRVSKLLRSHNSQMDGRNSHSRILQPQ